MLKPFVDLYLDTAGWYALGHHAPEKFLAALVEREPDFYANFSVTQVQLTWAKFQGNNFEVTDKPVWGSHPITLIEE